MQSFKCCPIDKTIVTYSFRLIISFLFTDTPSSALVAMVQLDNSIRRFIKQRVDADAIEAS